MKTNDLKNVALDVISNYSPFLTLETVKDVFTLPLPYRVKMRDFIVSKGLYYCDLVKYVYDSGDIEFFCTLSWLTPCYECSIVFLYDCKTQNLSPYHSVSRLKLK